MGQGHRKYSPLPSTSRDLFKLQSLKLLRPTVKEEMHLQEIWVKATQNIAQYPLRHVTYAPAKFEVAMSND